MGLKDVELGKDVRIAQPALVNLYGCRIGDETKVGAFVEIQRNATIGARCKISSHSFICEGVTIEDEVFIGHGVMFINDRFPRASVGGELQTDKDWKVVPTKVCKGASIGSGAAILCGITIGERALVGAGAVVTKDVPADGTVAGVPARSLR
ncbi:MAG TPA: acyltransferase [Gemmatimonadaceae bacterium]|nr:acyltransferase [Gemmatimonadaceae bacterium]